MDHLTMDVSETAGMAGARMLNLLLVAFGHMENSALPHQIHTTPSALNQE